MSQPKNLMTLFCLFGLGILPSQIQAQTNEQPVVISEEIAGPISNTIQSRPFDIDEIEARLTNPPEPTWEEQQAQRDYELAQNARIAKREVAFQEAQEKLKKELDQEQEPSKIELNPRVDEPELGLDDEDSMGQDDERLDDDDFLEDDDRDASSQRPAFGPWPRKGIRAITIDIRETSPNSPEDISGQLISSSKSNWTQFTPAPKVYAWAAPDIRYQPLYFEDVALERYGQTARPYAQSLSSGYHFWKSFWLLPHQMRHDHPGSCDHPLGFCRPGNAAPYTIQRHYFGTPPNARILPSLGW